ASEQEIPPSNVTSPSITGSDKVDSILNANLGTWEGAPTPTLSAQWQRYNGEEWNDINGATGNTYTTTEDDLGLDIRVKVEAINDHGEETAVSNTIGPIYSLANV